MTTARLAVGDDKRLCGLGVLVGCGDDLAGEVVRIRMTLELGLRPVRYLAVRETLYRVSDAGPCSEQRCPAL